MPPEVGKEGEINVYGKRDKPWWKRFSFGNIPQRDPQEEALMRLSRLEENQVDDPYAQAKRQMEMFTRLGRALGGNSE